MEEGARKKPIYEGYYPDKFRTRIDINISLIGVAFTIFIFLLALSNEILSLNKLVA